MSMERLTCGECGIEFDVPEHWKEARRRDHRDWYCPNGHCRVFKAESDIEQARRLALEAQAQVNREQHLRLVAERERDRAILQKKRIEKRVARGVCPCCNRSFENLARHMSTKHGAEMLLPGKQKLIEGTVQ